MLMEYTKDIWALTFEARDLVHYQESFPQNNNETTKFPEEKKWPFYIRLSEQDLSKDKKAGLTVPCQSLKQEQYTPVHYFITWKKF